MENKDFQAHIPRISAQLTSNLQEALGTPDVDAHFIPAMKLFVFWLEEARDCYAQITGKMPAPLEKELLELEAELDSSANLRYPAIQSMLSGAVLGYKEKLQGNGNTQANNSR